jgi:Peptidase A4 family
VPGHRVKMTIATVSVLLMLLAQNAPVSFAKSATGVAGYQANPPFGSSFFARVAATWNVPAVNCQPSLPESQQVNQVLQLQATIGGEESVLYLTTMETCPQGASSPTLSTEWYEQFPNGASASGSLYLSNGTIFTFAQGDKISAYINVGNNKAGRIAWALHDVTTGERGEVFRSTITCEPYYITCYEYAQWFVTGSSNCSSSVCTIALANFSTPIKFGGCYATNLDGTKYPLSSLYSTVKLNMVDNNELLMAKTSSISSAGTGFRVTFVSST